MTEAIKLSIAFVAGAILMFMVIGFTRPAEAPIINHQTDETSTETTNDATSTPDAAADAGVTDTEEPTPTPAPAPSTPAPSVVAPTPAPAPVAADPEPSYPTSAVVRFTGTRFDPKEVTIIKGGSITFVNASDDDLMRVATNFHPFHDSYPEKRPVGCSPTTFDQCTSTGPGGTWTFKFNEVGKWNYHEENRPVTTGQIQVLTKEDYDKRF